MAQANTPEEWFKSLPVVSRGWFVAALLSTVGFQFGLVNPVSLAFIPSQVIPGMQVWRLFTNFVFFGKFGMGFVFQLYLLVSYAVAYERNPLTAGSWAGPGVRSHPSAEFAFMLLFCGSLHLVVAGLLIGMYFMGSLLCFTVLYLWSRVHENEQVSIFGFRWASFGERNFLFCRLLTLLLTRLLHCLLECRRCTIHGPSLHCICSWAMIQSPISWALPLATSTLF